MTVTMTSNAGAENLHTHLENMEQLHKNLNKEVDCLNEKIHHTPYESGHLRKLKQRKLYLKDQIVQLRSQLDLKE